MSMKNHPQMKIGIMQPYFFPYIGYWQLFSCVDRYVILDDVNYIRQGWINRNRILISGKEQYINVYLRGASQNKRINEVLIGDRGKTIKNLDTIRYAYGKAPYFREVYPLIKSAISAESDNVAEYNGNILNVIGEYLGIDTSVYYSSELKKNSNLTGQDRIIEICKLLDGDMYINAIGGKKLYDRGAFAKQGIELRFLESELLIYPQFGNEFVPNLSIIDVLMFNSLNDIKEMLTRYKLKE